MDCATPKEPSAPPGRCLLHALTLVVFLCAYPSMLPAADDRAAALPEAVSRALNALKLDANGLSVFVQPVDSDKALLEWQPDTPRNPASTAKLVTTLAALEVLGPAYQWETRAYAMGTLSEGRLEGDLVLQGGGDPYLTAERFWSFLRALRARGLVHIAGDLVVDDSYFQVAPEDPRAFDGEPFRAYNVQPHALLVNFKAVAFQFFPDGNAVRIVADPPLANLQFDNQLRLRDSACTGFQRGVAFDLPNGFNDGKVVFSGSFPSRCTAYTISRTVLTPEDYAWGLFYSLWRELGGSIDGGVRLGTAPADLTPIFAMPSLSLAEVIRSVNKYSNNVMTRQLLYSLGVNAAGEPGTEANGLRAIADWLAANKLTLTSLKLDNGAGLSRDTRVSARDMVTLLTHAWHSPYSAEFIASMPLAGLDGTLKKRFNNEQLAGQMHLKTGRLDHVVAVAGYVRSRSGRNLAVAILHNDTDVHRGTGQQVQDAILRWVYRQ